MRAVDNNMRARWPGTRRRAGEKDGGRDGEKPRKRVERGGGNRAERNADGWVRLERRRVRGESRVAAGGEKRK